MKQIIVVSSYCFETTPVISNRILPMLGHLAGIRRKVTLISPDDRELDLGANIRHVTAGRGEFEKRGFLRRAAAEMNLSARLLWLARSHQDGDAEVLVTVPSMFLMFLCPLILKSPRYLDLRDLVWEYLSERNWVTSLAKRCLRLAAKISVRHYQEVVVTNSAELKYVRETLAYKSCAKVIPNGISQGAFDSLSRLNPSPSAAPFCVSYLGTVGLAQNVITLLEAAVQLPEVRFQIVGDGNDLNKVRNHIKSLGLTNVDSPGRVGWSEVEAAYERSDLLWAQLTEDFSSAVPSKIYEYLATGKQIVFGGWGMAREVLAQFENCQVINPEDPQALAIAIRDRSTGTSTARSVTNIQAIRENFIRERTVKQLLSPPAPQ